MRRSRLDDDRSSRAIARVAPVAPGRAAARARHGARDSRGRESGRAQEDRRVRRQGQGRRGVRVESSTGGILVSVGAVQVSVPPTVAGAGGALLAVALLREALRGGRRKGSVGALEERGALDENRDVDEEKFFKGMMKTVRTVEIPEHRRADPSRGSVVDRAARRRVATSRELKAAELPKNHPFATSEATDAAAVGNRRGRCGG